VREKRLEVQRQQMELAELKHRIFIAKRQLESVYNHDAIQFKEDENKNLRAELKALEDERDGHLNIQKIQMKALKIARNEEELGEKMNNVVGECLRLRKDSKQLIEQIHSSEKQLLKAHDSYVSKRESLR
jgi:hypothetical protein